MRKEHTNFAKSVKFANVDIGPIPPNPGPILPRQESVAVRLVMKSFPERESTNVPTNIVAKYVSTNVVILITVSDGNSLPFKVSWATLLG